MIKMSKMNKQTMIAILSVFVLAVAGFATVGDVNAGDGDDASWTGWITDTQCATNGAKEGHGDCAKRCAGRGEKLALIDDEGHMFILDPQDKAMESAGEYVKVTGTLADGTIEIATIETVEVAEKEAKEEKPGE